MKGSTGYADARPRVNALSSAIAATLAVSSAGVVQAQEQQQQQRSVDEITVTGSRIVRQDFTSNSPVQTVDEQAFQQTAIVGVETVLNKLPQFVPAVTQFTTGDVQQTATNTVGASTISLRGLGANRNLVLINGRRGMPVNPTMVVDTNSIPSSAIQRVEVISGGASAVYGADAVGGVVNFILKDDYEGASIDVRLGDTQHGGDQTTHVSGLFGVNSADDRGNIMLGIERDTRAKQFSWQRDWWVADRANPNTTGGFFAFGSATWFHNEPAANLAPGAPGSFGFANNPDQNVVNSIFPAGACPNPSPSTGCTISNNLNSTRFRINRDGSVFTGLQDSQSLSPGAYLFNGPVWNDGQSGDLDGAFQGLPVFVRMANGAIKENVMYNWASSPLERLSGFANGHFDISDNIRLTGQAMVTRTKTESSLGLSSANINQWGAGIPFGNGLYRGNSDPYFDIPDSLCTVAGRDGCTAAGVTNPAYTLSGRFGVNCDAPVGTPGMPWADGQPGCTKSEAFPVPPDIYRLMLSRGAPTATPGVGAGGEEIVWASREPDWMRNALGAARSTTNTTTTMSFSMGIEGDLPSGNHSWDVTLATGRSDNTVNQLGSMRLHSYRDVLAYPNWGKGAFFDPNPWESAGFAETNPTCTSGLPIADNRQVSEDCVQILAPALKNLQEMTQTTLEANLTGDLAQMKAGPLQYALGTSYRENSFDYTPDNLSDQQNEIDTVAGLFPTEHSAGEFDVTELYGELLVPLISDGPTGVEHFNLELGARISDWSMPQMPDLKTYKALVDWGITPRYRIRGGFNRAFRAPNLGELFVARTQIFGGGGATRDWCSTGLDLGNRGSFSATPADFVAATATNPGNPGTPTAQTAQSRAICEALMGAQGTAFYYDIGRTQDAVGGAGIPNSFGNPNLREEQADTWTLGVTMDLLEDWRLSVDWWKIDIEDMIALEGGDATYQACLDIAFNPTGNPNAPACQRIFRNPTTGGGGIINRSFTNQGLASFEGVDIQLNWSHQLSGGGSLNLNSSLTTTLHEITQDTPSVAPVDQKGYNNCSLQLQCLNYDYRVFTTLGYGRGMWNVSLTHQYWPDLPNNSCRTNVNAVSCLYNSLPAYQLFSANANIRFNDKYTFSVGLENLLDKDPPCLNSNPTLTPTPTLPFQFPTDCTHSGDGSTYDPLGRTYFISMTMDF